MESTSRPTKKTGMPKADFAMGIILMIFGLVAVQQSLAIPTFKKDWGGFYAAPGFVPFILGLVIFGLSLIMLVRAVRQGGYRIIPTKEAVRELLAADTTRRWCLTMVYSWGFFFLLGHVYFYILAFAVLFAFMATFGDHKIYVSLITSLGASAAIYLVFTKIFLVPLP